MGNFMTPNDIMTVKTSRYHIELSSGNSMIKGKTLYGITVTDLKDRYHLSELSKCVHSRKEADEYIDSLKKK